MKKYTAIFLALVLMFGVLIDYARAEAGEHSIVINLVEYRLYHYIGGQLVETYPISIGHINSPTPVSSDTRRFEIYSKVINPWWKSPTTGVVVPPGPTNPLGTRWLGLMTIDKLTLTGAETWESLAKKYGATVSGILNHNNLKPGTRITPGLVVEVPHSDGYGIHGTIVPSSIGTSVSLGCMRMHNADVERLFDALPSGKRIGVTINYLPLVERTDSLTGEGYYEVMYDVYRRVKNWSEELSRAAQHIGAEINPWLANTLSQRFSDKFLITKNPAIYNNGSLVSVGARRQEDKFFIPIVIAEAMLGERYTVFDGVHYLGAVALEDASVAAMDNMLYVDSEVIREHTGRGHYYYEPMLNMLQFSTTRLSFNGAILSYNRVFVHPTWGPMVAITDLTEVLAAEPLHLGNGQLQIGDTVLKGEALGAFVYVDSAELARLGMQVDWNPQSGELALVTAEVVAQP